jgi:hypothetical protein
MPQVLACGFLTPEFSALTGIQNMVKSIYERREFNEKCNYGKPGNSKGFLGGRWPFGGKLSRVANG